MEKHIKKRIYACFFHDCFLLQEPDYLNYEPYKPEPYKPEHTKPEPFKPELLNPDLLKPDSLTQESVKPDSIIIEDSEGLNPVDFENVKNLAYSLATQKSPVPCDH